MIVGAATPQGIIGWLSQKHNTHEDIKDQQDWL